MLKIHSAARRHRVSERNIEHAVRHAMITEDLDDGKRLYLGPGSNGDLLEVVTISKGVGIEVAIHAMRMRRRYRYLLGEEI
jgi:hypothetical protein